ncbi:hypothetical protein EUX98_g7310 [Antrodiella citrinella]|uniref:DNA replication regulator Sld3 C-terminal domain-containing protein n=1 Tax=Antrodiella citrinella TaxID=2447956 RepID=A0A4S4MNT3_9APHY|nr:hypothetical protein EUX98_g7310 [Antrodiella citrinella]
MSPVLLTARSSAQKYQSRIPHLLSDEDVVPDEEANILWYAYKFAKADDDHAEQDQEAEEKWKASWLDRLERREVMIQILLYSVLLSLSEPPKDDETFGDPTLLTSPKKRKKASTPLEPTLPYELLEDRLEGFMDKLSMWQLTDALEKAQRPNVDHNKQTLPNSKGKGKQTDEHDRMQVFCEDVVEPFFKSTLPSYCAMLRSKVFPQSPFSDESDGSSSPPPTHQNKRAKTSTSSSRRTSPRPKTKSQSRPLERTRSLSVTLEEERERSRSQSIGPGNVRKRVLTREVSMSTVFKPKPAKPKAQVPAEKKPSVTTQKDQPRRNDLTSEKQTGDKDKGRTLVTATPVKPKNKSAQLGSRAGSSTAGGKLPALSVGMSQAVEMGTIKEDEEDDEWMLASSPDVLLLTSSSGKEDWDSVDDDEAPADGQDSGTKVLTVGTPKKSTRGA